MTRDEIFDGILNETLDTHQFSDAFEVVRDFVEDDFNKVLKAFDAGESWLFLVGPPPQHDDDPLFDCSHYALLKGGVLTVDAPEDLLTRKWPEVPIPDLA